MIMETTEYSTKEMSHHSSKDVKLELSDSYPLHISSGPLNFATSVEDYEMHGPPSKKPKTPRDPMSHRIIEKRRRDRMNNCLADLSRLIPANYMKQGQGRIEKTEIIEMAIRHIKHLQNVHRSIVSQGQCCAEKFYLGFKECEAETIRYFVECEGLDSKDQFCMRVISHLEAASQKYITANQNCEYRKEETNVDDKGSLTPTISSECENTKPQNLKSEMAPQSVPAILAPTHESIASATSKQLRNLLSHGSSGFDPVDSGNGSCGDSLGPFSSNESYVSTNQHDDGGSLLAGAESDSIYRSNSGSEGSSSSSSSKDSKFTNYKFKHDITKRFSQEEKYSIDPSTHHEHIHEHESNVYEKHSHSHEKHSLDKHGHSYEKHEKHEKLSGKLKRKMVRSKSPSSSSDSTIYPTSEHSSNGNSGNMSSIQCRTAESDLVTTGVPLPAFVLHPQGTHYLPLTIQPSCFQNALPQLDRLQQPLVFHPISILVNFSAPGLVIQNAEAFVSSVNPLTSFPSNICGNAGPITNISGSSSANTGREHSGNRSSSGKHTMMNISSGSLSSSSSTNSIGNNNGNMNCSPTSSGSSNCGSMPPNSRVVTPPNNIPGAITTMAPSTTTPVMNTSLSHNTMQPSIHIPPVLLGGGVSGSEHHLVVNNGLPGSAVIANTSTSPINTNNNGNNSNGNLSTNTISLHSIPPPPLHSPLPHHLSQQHPTNINNNNNSSNSNTNMNTTSSHLKMEESSSNVVPSSHCYSSL